MARIESVSSVLRQKHTAMGEFRAVGIGGAEGLQPHQYFRITVVKEDCRPTDIRVLL